MNKLLVGVMASAFAFVAASALAQAPAMKPKPATQAIPSDSSLMPLSKMDTEQAKAARAAAKAKWDSMTPEEQAAARKAMQHKRLQDLTALDEYVVRTEGATYNAQKGAAEAAASKAQPLPTKAERQKDLGSATKGSTGQ